MQENSCDLSQNALCTHLRPLKLVEALNSRSMDRLRYASPWDHYVAVGDPLFDGDVMITNARLKGSTPVSVTIQSASWTPAVRTRMASLLRLAHDNLSAIRDVFVCDNQVHVVFESSPVSLADIAGHDYLTEALLATILAQVINCLCYSERKNITLGLLACSDVGVDSDGTIKIACRILCRGNDKCKDIEHLGRLTMNLMQGYEKDTGAIGLDDLEGWSLEAVTFLSDTTSAVSVRELAEHGLFRKAAWDKRMLAELCQKTQLEAA